jgi:hypothetical protein
MDNLNPRFLLMGWMFAKNAFWAQSSHKENDSNGYLTDSNEILLEASGGLYLIPKMEV